MDLNDPSLFTPTITASNNNPFEFVQENAINNPGATGMSGYEVSPVTKTT